MGQLGSVWVFPHARGRRTPIVSISRASAGASGELVPRVHAP
jgi:hypothetical protein